MYACFWDKSYLPLLDEDILDVISANMSQAISNGIESGSLLNFTRQFERTCDVMALAINESTIPETVLIVPGTKSPVSGGEDSNQEEDQQPLDVHSWDTLRYVGLGVFVATIVLTTSCMSLASYRQHRLTKKYMWGNLKLDEAGVNELLKTGWKIQDHKTVQVFDKHGHGYCDDDSVLIGGYEQREACTIGGEIVTVTQSETTPNTWSEQRDRVRY